MPIRYFRGGPALILHLLEAMLLISVSLVFSFGLINQLRTQAASISPPPDSTIDCACGYEGDVDERLNKFGIISVVDWVKEGRFAAGLDIANPGCEFQRADVSPRDSFGDGSISISDWVQVGRYAAGLEGTCLVPEGCSQACAAGPTGPLSGAVFWVPPAKSDNGITVSLEKSKDATVEPTTVDLVSTISPTGRRSISIDLEAEGSENALGFSLLFDPAKLLFISAEKSNEVSGATLLLNTREMAKGRIGILLALPAGETFVKGRHLVELMFKRSERGGKVSLIQVADQPVAREVVDLYAKRRNAIFNINSRVVRAL